MPHRRIAAIQLHSKKKKSSRSKQLVSMHSSQVTPDSGHSPSGTIGHWRSIFFSFFFFFYYDALALFTRKFPTAFVGSLFSFLLASRKHSYKHTKKILHKLSYNTFFRAKDQPEFTVPTYIVRVFKKCIIKSAEARIAVHIKLKYAPRAQSRG